MKISTKRTFTHDVPVLVPADDGHVEDTLRTTFNYLDTEEARAFDLTTPAGIDGFVDAIVGSFHDCTDDNGNALPYTPELRAELLKRQYVCQALMAHYGNAVTKVKLGN